MVDTPCSRIGNFSHDNFSLYVKFLHNFYSSLGHIYKHNPFPDPRAGKDYLSKNFKRVAEVWMVREIERMFIVLE